MNKYAVLIVLNAPLVLYALFDVFLSYKLKRFNRLQAIVRFLFWGFILTGIVYNKPITDYLYAHDLTKSPPLSIFDVFLATGLVISLLLVGRAYGRIATLEDRLTQLHESASLRLSTDPEAHRSRQPIATARPKR